MSSNQIKNLYITYQNTLLILFFIGGILKGIIKSYFLNIDLTLITAILVLIDSTLMFIFRSRSIKLTNNTIIPSITLLLFYISFFISLLYTHSGFYAYQKTSFFFLNILCFFYPMLMIEFRIEYFKKALKYTILPLSIWFIYMRHQYWLPKNEDIRLAKEGFFNISGLYLSLGSVIGIYILSLYYSKKRSWVLILFSVIILFALGARGPLIFIILTIFILNLKHFINRVRNIIINKKLYIAIIGVIVTIPVALVKFRTQLATFMEYGIYRFSSLINFESDNSSLGRIERMDFAINSVFDSIPAFFFGHGIGSFGILFSGKDAREYPHNIILETLFELGIFPTMLIILFLIFPFLFKTNNLFKALSLFMLFDSFKSGNLTDLWILFSLYGLAIFVKKTQEKNGELV